MSGAVELDLFRVSSSPRAPARRPLFTSASAPLLAYCPISTCTRLETSSDAKSHIEAFHTATASPQPVSPCNKSDQMYAYAPFCLIIY